MIKKGLLLCAGMGSRLRPITYTTAKHVLPAANKPIIYHTIEMLQRSGVDNIGIVVGANRQEFLREVGDGKRWGVQIDYIDQDEPLGTAHAVKIAADWAGDDPFVMVLGDIMTQDGIETLLAQYDKDEPASMVVLHHTDHPKLYGIAEIDDGHIVGLEEKPEHPKSNLAVAGIYIFQRSIFDAIDTIKPSSRGELELPDAIRALITEGRVVDPFMLEGWWKDTGRPEDILDLNRLLLDELKQADIAGNVDSESVIVGSVIIDKTATVKRSNIRGPVIIGPGSVVSDAYVGPYTSLGADVTIDKTEIEYSVVMDGSFISGIRHRIGSSLIGKGVRLTHNATMPNVHQLVVGDSCQLNLV